MNNTLTLRHLPRTPMSIRETFWTAVAAIVFGLLNAVYFVGVFVKAAFETVVLGKDAKRQLRQYDDDINGAF
jgi:hypothetical protein